MSALFLSIATLALLNAARLSIAKAARVATQRIAKAARKVRGAAKPRCTFAS